jgi:Tol biopolymer transport system component
MIDERGRRAADAARRAVDESVGADLSPLERFERRRGGRGRMQRIGAATVAAAIGVAAIWTVVTVLRPADPTPLAPLPGGRILFGRWDAGRQQAAWYTADPDGSGLVDLGIVATCAEWFPDGRRILVTNDAERGHGTPLRPAVVAPDGSVLEQLDGVPDRRLELGCGDVSPDGSTLVLEGFDDQHTTVNGIFTVRATDGGGLERLTTGADSYPQYSPDGSEVVFQRTKPGVQPDGAGALFVVAAEGGPDRRITPWGSAFLDQGWSPDGAWIAFQRPYGELMLVRPDGSNLHAVPLDLPAGFGAAEPSWSPDGRWVVFAAQRGTGQADIYAVRPDGTGLQRIIDAGGQAAGPDWAP